MKVNTEYMELSNILCQLEQGMILSRVGMGKLKEEFKEFKKEVVELFWLYCQPGP